MNELFQRLSELGLEVSRGNISGWSSVHKFGLNSDVDTSTTPEDLWEDGGLFPHQSSAVSLEILSSSSSDASGGNGMMTATVEGLDTNWDIQTENVTLNGITPVALSNTYLRIHRIFGLTAGSNGTNAGTITLRVPGPGDTQGIISADNGQTLMAVYTIPNAKTGYLMKWYSGATKQQPSASDVQMMIREFDANPCWRVQDSVGIVTRGVGWWQYEYPFPTVFQAKTDIRITITNVTTNNVSVAGGFDLLLIDD